MTGSAKRLGVLEVGNTKHVSGRHPALLEAYKTVCLTAVKGTQKLSINGDAPLDGPMEKNQSQSLSYIVHNNQFQIIVDLNVKFKTIKVLEEIGECGHDFCLLNRTKKSLNRKINENLEHIKIKYLFLFFLSFLQKIPLGDYKKHPMKWEKIFPMSIYD